MTELYLEITEDEFEDRYPLRINHLDPSAGWALRDNRGCLFAPHGQELIWVCTHNRRYIWTLVDGDDGDMYILSGYHIVNRIGYFLSVNPIPDQMTVQVRIPMNHDDPMEQHMPRHIDATIRLRLSLPHFLSLDDLDRRLPELLAIGFGNHLVIEQDSPTLLGAIDLSENQFQRTLPLHDLLAENKQVAVVWEVEDVLAVRPDLSDDQAWTVLEQVKHNHDACIGINWEVLSDVANELFGRAASQTTDIAGLGPD